MHEIEKHIIAIIAIIETYLLWQSAQLVCPEEKSCHNAYYNYSYIRS